VLNCNLRPTRLTIGQSKGGQVCRRSDMHLHHPWSHYAALPQSRGAPPTAATLHRVELITSRGPPYRLHHEKLRGDTTSLQTLLVVDFSGRRCPWVRFARAMSYHRASRVSSIKFTAVGSKTCVTKRKPESFLELSLFSQDR
jgi:hypothetical protein